MKSPAKAGDDAVETGRQIMDIRLDKDALAVDDAMTMIRARPLDRAKAISGLINEEALASERLGRLTDKATAAMLDANLFSIRLPKPEGGLGGTGVELFEATEEIARADGSAGWCMLISNTGSTFVHIGAGVKVRREVFGNGPVACWAPCCRRPGRSRSKPVFACRAIFRSARAVRWHAGSWSPGRSPIAMASNGSGPTYSQKRMSRSRRVPGMSWVCARPPASIT